MAKFKRNPLDEVFTEDLQMSAHEVDIVTTVRNQIERSDCQGCKLHKARGQKKPVPGEGRGKIMFVGHTIGSSEARQTRPAIGAASKHGLKLFFQALPLANEWHVTKNDAREWLLDYVYLTNATRCGAEETPTRADYLRCAGAKGPNWLSIEVSYVDPVLIVFQNKQAAKAVLGKENVPARGQVAYRYVYGTKRPVMLMAHPVRVAYTPEEEDTVVADFRSVATWLEENGYLKKPTHFEKKKKAEHHLVTTRQGLEEMKQDLMDEPYVALDTETFFKADIKHFESILEGGHEGKKGALLWHADRFEVVCYQMSALRFTPDGEPNVTDTWTVALRFRNRTTGEPRQSITPEEGLDALDDVLSRDLRQTQHGKERVVFMWNALFDCPVLTQEGIDMWGMTHNRYPIHIWDGMQVFVRLNERLGRKEGRSTLDNAAAIYLGERKGSFTDRFDPRTFAYEDIREPVVRSEVLEYCGEDPRKTALVCWEVLCDLDQHISDRRQHITDRVSSHHRIGRHPFPKVASKHTEARIRDVALPLDHQMIPIIGEMTMLGFKLKKKPVDEAEMYYKDLSSRLLTKVEDTFPGFNPNSSPHTVNLIRRAFRQVKNEINRLRDEYPDHAQDFVDSFQVYLGKNETEVKEKMLVAAFERVYGELTAERSVVQDKLLTYYSISYQLLEAEAKKVGAAVDINDKLKPDALADFFKSVYLYKQLDKKWGTYFLRFKEMQDRRSIIHPTYSLTSTLSGRYSGNFQNVPRGGEEDREFIEDMLINLGMISEEPSSKEEEEEREDTIKEYNRFDVRQACYPPQANDLNQTFVDMNLRYQSGKKKGEHWSIDDEPYVVVCADFAAQEDRMAFALSGDETKARLLSNPDLDTHFYNVAFCFGDKHGFDTSTEDGQMRAYHYFTKQKEIGSLRERADELVEEHGTLTDGGVVIPDHIESEVREIRAEIRDLKKQKKKYKRKYRTPMKTVHYASQYGAGVEKLHTVIKPIFISMGEEWSIEDTENLKAKYDQLYAGVTKAREEILDNLERVPYIEYPIYGTLRHAQVDIWGKVRDGLSVANALNQGTCAYVTKLAMLRMRELIYQNKERWGLVQAGGSNYVGLLLQVHDEIAILCPASLAKEVCEALESAMKMIVEPGEESAYYNTSVPDARGETGWLSLPDRQLEGQTLLDADAEVKQTVAKVKQLSNGNKNMLAKMDEPESIAALTQDYPFEPNAPESLVLAKNNATDVFI